MHGQMHSPSAANYHHIISEMTLSNVGFRSLDTNTRDLMKYNLCLIEDVT